MAFEMCDSRGGSETTKAVVMLQVVSFLLCIAIDGKTHWLARVFENFLD